MCRDFENLTAAPKFSGVEWTQIYADFGLGFDYATDYTAIRSAWNKGFKITQLCALLRLFSIFR